MLKERRNFSVMLDIIRRFSFKDRLPPKKQSTINNPMFIGFFFNYMNMKLLNRINDWYFRFVTFLFLQFDKILMCRPPEGRLDL